MRDKHDAREHFCVNLQLGYIHSGHLLAIGVYRQAIARRLRFSGELWYWRGPAPHDFVTVPEEHSSALKGIAGLVTYGWGMIPVRVRVGNSEWKTSLFPKDGRYLVPIKALVRKAENLAEGDTLTIRLDVQLSVLPGRAHT